MTFDEKKEELAMIDEKILLADGFEDALIGYGEQFNKTFAVYDRSKCIQIIMDRDGMTLEEEYFEFNVVGAYVGDLTPCFTSLFDASKV
jgi:hypothetical protein